jgi:HEAT repeat protein
VVPKKVIEYHISRLQDKNPAARLKAIKELELIGAHEALEPLKALFQNDPDNEVRKAAQAAGRAIFLKNQQSKSE